MEAKLNNIAKQVAEKGGMDPQKPRPSRFQVNNFVQQMKGDILHHFETRENPAPLDNIVKQIFHLLKTIFILFFPPAGFQGNLSLLDIFYFYSGLKQMEEMEQMEHMDGPKPHPTRFQLTFC